MDALSELDEFMSWDIDAEIEFQVPRAAGRFIDEYEKESEASKSSEDESSDSPDEASESSVDDQAVVDGDLQATEMVELYECFACNVQQSFKCYPTFVWQEERLRG